MVQKVTAAKSGQNPSAKKRQREIVADSAPSDRSLESVELFSCLPEVDFQEVERACKWRRFSRGDTILTQDETGNDVYFIMDGEARVLIFWGSGRTVTYASLEPGDYFGELSAIDELPRSATVVARTKCTVVVLPGDQFRRLATSNSRIALLVMKKLASVVRLGDARIVDLSLLGVQQRLCLELLRLAEPDEANLKNWAIFPLPTQQELAEKIGTTRVSVARIFSQLSKAGIAHRKSHALYIPDRGKLEELVFSEHDENSSASI